MTRKTKKKLKQFPKKQKIICTACGGVILAGLNYCPLCDYGKCFSNMEEEKA